MKWLAKGAYYLKSSEGYYVSGSRVKGRFRYTSWTPEKEMLGCFDTPPEARAECEKHYKEKQTEEIQTEE